MVETLVDGLRGINELLTAGIAITAFSLLLYALSFNLRDRVARSFAIILLCVVFVSVGDAIASNSGSAAQIGFWMRIQWIGILFLPPAYLHFSDALLETTGRPSRGRRRRLVWVLYLVSIGFLNKDSQKYLHSITRPYLRLGFMAMTLSHLKNIPAIHPTLRSALHYQKIWRLFTILPPCNK